MLLGARGRLCGWQHARRPLGCIHGSAVGAQATAFGRPSVQQRCSKRRVAAAASAVEDAEEEFAGEDFYTILGVTPRASTKEIKKAYYNIMKDCHPDLSGDEESTEFCTLLNEIYETLTDPDKRSLYDALVGFSEGAINPFLDTDYPLDQVFVDEFTCIGCRNCTNVSCRTFEIEDDWGRARVIRQGVDTQDKLQEAIDTCPVSCIHWVSSPQLSLLEAAMARMERVAVWSLMSGGGGGRDVFTEASMSWEKRQQAVRARRQQQQDAAAWSTFWAESVGAATGANMYAQAARASKAAADAARRGGGPRPAADGSSSASGSYDSEESWSGGSYDDGDAAWSSGEADSSFSGKDGQRIAALAAKAARASRAWKSMQELQQQQQQKNRLLLVAAVGQEEA